MYLQLAGHTPLHNALNPMAPGATPYSYDAMYLGQGQDIILPDALYKTSPGGFVDALKKLKKLYEDFQDGKKPTPAVVAARAFTAAKPTTGVQRASTIQPMNGVGAVIALLSQAIPFIVSILGTISATLVNNNITNKYSQNAYNVQQLNNMNVSELNLQIQRLDMDIAASGGILKIINLMALSQFRMVYQQRFDRISVGGGFLSNLPGWVLPAALGLGAFLLLRGRK